MGVQLHRPKDHKVFVAQPKQKNAWHDKLPWLRQVCWAFTALQVKHDVPHERFTPEQHCPMSEQKYDCVLLTMQKVVMVESSTSALMRTGLSDESKRFLD